MLDGSVSTNANSISHSWDVGGSYTISVTVSDMKGGTLTLNKTVTVTDPLGTWTAGSVGTTNDLKEVVWGKGRFIAAYYWGTVYMSWDGSTWANVGDPPSFDSQPHLAFGNDVFVMAGKIDNAAAAQICWSADGRTWSTAAFPAGVPQVQRVTFGNGMFIAVGDGGTVLRSADGKTWTLTSVPTTPNFRHITWDGSSTWLAVAMNAAQSRPEVVWTSLDGITWSQRSSLGVDVFRTFGAGGVMYALGWYAGIEFSTDHGITWQDAAMPGTTRWTTYLMALADDGTFFVTAKAMDESGSPYALLVSVDGTHWTRSTANSGNTAVGNANGLAYGFGKFVTVENNGVTRSSNGLYTSNAAPVPSFIANPTTVVARQPVQLAATATDANGDTLTYAWDIGSQFAILDGPSIVPSFAFGGSYTITLRVSESHGGLATLTHNTTVSDPARTWTQRTSGTTKGINGIAANASLVVAVGDSATIRTSPDGITWTTRSVSEYDGNMTFRAIVWDGAKFIISGEDYNSSTPGWVSLIYTSSDGITWTQRLRGSTPSTELHAIATNGTGAVAVGNSGTVMSSANGTTWSNVAAISGIGSSQTFAGIAWNGSIYALAGYTGNNGGVKVYTSTTGSSWIDRSAGAGVAGWQDLRSIAWLNNRFVASGWYSSLRVSIDSAQTFSTTRSHTEINPAMAYGDGIYYTAGEDKDNSSADVDVLSLDGTAWYSFAAPTTSNRYAAVFYKHHFISVGAGGNIWQSDDTTPPASFATWQATNFPGGGVAALATSDPDLDGVVNLLEYALNLNPNSAALANGILATGRSVILSERTWLHLDMPEPALADATYTMQGSSTLTGTWTPLAQKVGSGTWLWLGGGTSRITQGTASGGRKPIEVGVPDSATGLGKYFLRLQVDVP